MANATPVSKGIHDLLMQERREAERDRVRYHDTKQQGRERFQRQELHERQRQASANRALRITQQQHRDVVKHYAGYTTTVAGLIGALKQQTNKGRAEWDRFSKGEQRALDKIAKSGGTQADAQKALLRFHRRQGDKLDQQHHHYLQQNRQQQRQDEALLLKTYRATQFGRRQHYQQERHEVREIGQQQRVQQRQEEQDIQRRKAFLASVPRHVIGSLHGTAAIGRALQNPFLSQEQRLIGIGHALGQFGGPIGVIGELTAALVELKRVVDGTTQALMHLHFFSGQMSVTARGMERLASLEHKSIFDIRQQEHLAAARGETIGAIKGQARNLVELAGGRSTWKGELAYRQAKMRFAAQVRLETAAGEAVAARKSLEDANQLVEEGRIRGNDQDIVRGNRYEIGRADYDRAGVERMQTGRRWLDEHRRDADRARARLNAAYAGRSRIAMGGDQEISWGNQKQIAEALEGKLKAEQTGLAHVRTLQEDITRQRQAQLTVAEKEKNVRDAQINLLKAEQQILAQKEQRQAHGAVAVGRMTDAQRAQFSTAMQLLEGGMPLHRMPPHLRALLEQVAPEAIQKRYETAGAQTREYEEAQRRGLIDQGTLAATRVKQEQIEGKMAVKLELNQQQFAKDVARALGEEFRGLIRVMVEQIQLELRNNETGQMMRHANQ